jgi:hypothetical protein
MPSKYLIHLDQNHKLNPFQVISASKAASLSFPNSSTPPPLKKLEWRVKLDVQDLPDACGDDSYLQVVILCGTQFTFK